MTPTQFNKGSVLFSSLFLSTFCSWYPSCCGNTLVYAGNFAVLPSSRPVCSPASIGLVSCVFKIMVIWNKISKIWIPFFSLKLLRYFIYIIYYFILLYFGSPYCMSLWERHRSERAKTGFGVSNENRRRKMNTQRWEWIHGDFKTRIWGLQLKDWWWSSSSHLGGKQ